MKTLGKFPRLGSVAAALTIAFGGVGAMYAAPGGAADPSFDQILERANAVSAKAHENFSHVLHLQQIAKRERDIIKLNCINDKLVVMKPEMNIADRAVEDLRVSRESGGQQSDFDSLQRASDEIQRARDAADECIGEKLLTSESSNQYTHPDVPDVPGTDPFGNEIEPPAYASPFD